AVSAFAQVRKELVQHLIGEFREFGAEKNLVKLADKGGHIIFVRTWLPEEVHITLHKRAKTGARKRPEAGSATELVVETIRLVNLYAFGHDDLAAPHLGAHWLHQMVTVFLPHLPQK